MVLVLMVDYSFSIRGSFFCAIRLSYLCTFIWVVNLVEGHNNRMKFFGEGFQASQLIFRIFLDGDSLSIRDNSLTLFYFLLSFWGLFIKVNPLIIFYFWLSSRWLLIKFDTIILILLLALLIYFFHFRLSDTRLTFLLFRHCEPSHQVLTHSHQSHIQSFSCCLIYSLKNGLFLLFIG